VLNFKAKAKAKDNDGNKGQIFWEGIKKWRWYTN